MVLGRFFAIYTHIFFDHAGAVRAQIIPPGWLLNSDQIKSDSDLDLPDSGPVVFTSSAGQKVGNAGTFRLAKIPDQCQYCNEQKPQLVLLIYNDNHGPIDGIFICERCKSFLSNTDRSRCSQYSSEIGPIVCQEGEN